MANSITGLYPKVKRPTQKLKYDQPPKMTPGTNATGARVSINSRVGGLVIISALLTKRDLASKDFD